MKSYIKITIAIISFTIVSCSPKKEKIVAKNSLAFFENTRTGIQPKFQLLPVNQIKPEGWIKDIMSQDISEGFIAQLDNLVPKLMNDDAFNTARRKDKTDIPDVGTQKLTGAEWEISMQWWAGETLGNWWDGYLRNAYMTDNKIAILKINTIVEELLSTQDADGYLGIYGEEMRYKHEGSNGELWAQTVLFRMLLGYYEFSGDETALKAVEKAMSKTMDEYNAYEKNPFDVAIDYGGVTHGLMMTDVCETLYRITSNKKYNDYAVYLYRNFSEYPINRAFNDVRYDLLMEKDSLFQSHSAHTYEHFRSLLLAKQITGYPELEVAYQSAMNKLSNCILPSGAGFGNEWLNKEKSDPNTTSAEFCGMLELSHFYASALQKTGEISYADSAEKITYNAMLGARNSSGKGITYCKTDNCYILNEKAPQSGFEEHDMRYKYSPTHADAAVCCNPSYGRNFPYFVSNMWMKSDDGLVATLYGPSTVTTNYNGVSLKIEEITNYPFSDDITFAFTSETEVALIIYLRKPNWTTQLNIEVADAEIVQSEGYYGIYKKWKTGDTIQVSFENEIKPVHANNNEIALQRGAIVYALNVPHREEIIKQYEINGFTDYQVFSTKENYKNLALNTSENKNSFGFKHVKSDETSTINPWNTQNGQLVGKLFNTKANKFTEVTLIPMGSTVLRRVTFPVK